MATRENTRVGEALPLRARPRGPEMIYTGSREQLLDAGIVGPDTPFPGDPGQRKTYLVLKDDPRRITRIRPVGRGRFTVDVRRPDDEIAQIERESEARDEAWRRESKARDEAKIAKRQLERMPDSFDAWRQQHAEGAALMLRATVSVLSSRAGGYRFAADVAAEMDRHVEAIEGLIATGTIEFDPSARQAERERLHAVAAAGDSTFHRFMRAAKARA